MPPKKKAAKKSPAVDNAVPEAYRKAPTGTIWVYNRLSKPFSIVFDGVEEAWDAHEYRLCRLDVAGFAVRKGIYKWDPANDQTVRALVDMQNKNYGVPFNLKEEEKGDELLVRSARGNTPTQVETVEVPD